MTHLVGQQLGRYLVQEQIGRGGMARVYRALDTSLQRTVALKVLAPQLAVDPEFARRFEREAQVAANLRHPNIVTIFDVGEHDGLRYIAMEYVRGRTLHAIIEERGALGLGTAVAIVGPVAAALDYAHSRGAVHRDVKPQNIMIDTDGRVLLTDFGIAQAPEGDVRGERLTRTGIFMGTPEYISPEQASAQRVDGRSDLYSLGIATYEMITGMVPFSGTTPQLIVAHAQNTPPPPSSVDPGQPPELDRVLARILAKRPESRFADGKTFVDELRQVVRARGIALPPASELAALALPRDSSAGQSTVSLGRGETARGQQAPVVPPRLPTRPPPESPRTPPPDALPTQAARSTPIRPAPSPRPAPARPTAPPGPAASTQRRPADDDRYGPPTWGETPAAPAGRSQFPWAVIVAIGVILVLVLVAVQSRNIFALQPQLPTIVPQEVSATQVTDTPTPTPTATSTPTPTATLTPTEAPTEAPTAVPTLPPTAAPTRAPVRPTDPPPPPTPIPPTQTPIPPTQTPIPPTATLTPTETLAPELTPTLTPTPDVLPPPPPLEPTATPTPTGPPTTPILPSQLPTVTVTLVLPTEIATLTPTITLTSTATLTTSLTLHPFYKVSGGG